MWTVSPIPGGYKVADATGKTVAYVYASDIPSEVASGERMSRAEAAAAAHSIAAAMGGKPPAQDTTNVEALADHVVARVAREITTGTRDERLEALRAIVIEEAVALRNT